MKTTMLLTGPYDYDSGSCQTCGNSFVDCVGHMGHIKLCKPVYNRVFGRAVYSIMRMSCHHCFKLQLPGKSIRLNLTLHESHLAKFLKCRFLKYCRRLK